MDYIDFYMLLMMHTHPKWETLLETLTPSQLVDYCVTYVLGVKKMDKPNEEELEIFHKKLLKEVVKGSG